MRCEEFEARLNELLDERRPLSSAADIEQHLRHCANCRQIFRSYEAVTANLHYNAVPAEPAWLTARIVQQARLAPAERPNLLRFPRRVPAMALAAAALLLAVGLAWIGHVRHSAENPAGAGADGLVAQVSKSPETSESAPRVDEGSSASIVVNQALTPPPEQNSSNTENLIGSLPAAEWAQPGAEWAQEVADGLQPVTQPTVGAINGFLNLWGVGPKGRRS